MTKQKSAGSGALGLAVLGTFILLGLKKPGNGGGGNDQGDVNFTSIPPGADVTVGGSLIGQTPVTRAFLFGSYSAVFSKSGYQSATASFTASATPADVNVTLTALPSKTWLTWQIEVLSIMSTSSAVTDIIRNLYNRMLADPLLAIPATTTTEQAMLNTNIEQYLWNLGGNPGMVPTLTDKLAAFGFGADLINFVFNGRNV